MVDLPEIDAKEVFGKLNFSKRKELLSNLLNCATKEQLPVSLPQCWVEFFELCINAHHRSHGETKVHSIVLRANSMYRHNNFHCSFTRNGQQIDEVVGIGATLSAKPNREPNAIKRAKLIKFLRFAVGWDMNAIKQHLLAVQTHCGCGAQLTPTTAHVDHTGEREFRHLANEFIDEIGLDQFTLVPFEGHNDFLTDEDLVLKWLDYHNSVAKVVVCCATCNLTKSKVW